jgi:hypothetical protein
MRVLEMNDRLLTIETAMQTFFSRNFHWWNECEWGYSPTDRTLYIFCQKVGLRGQVLRDSGRLSRIDIGIDRVVASRPGHQDLVILCLSSHSFSQFLES